MSAKLKYACIGAGGIADKKHLNGYSKVNGVEIAAVCDSNSEAAQRLAGKYGVSIIYTDYHELLDKEKPDIISICTPNYLHAPIAIEALKKGVNVHCEKPMALNSLEAREIIAAKDKSGCRMMLGLNYRFTNEAQFVKDYVQAGFLGEIYHARCGWRRRNGIPGMGVWFTDKSLSGGGSLIDLGVHFLDLVLYFMGYPRVETVFGRTYSKFGNVSSRLRPGYRNNGEGPFNVEDMAVGMVSTVDRASIDFEFSWASNIEKETRYYELMGTKGGVCFRDGELKVFSEVMGTSVNLTPELNNTVSKVNEFEHFVNCIRTGSEPLAAPEQGLILAGIIDGLYMSKGRPVELDK